MAVVGSYNYVADMDGGLAILRARVRGDVNCDGILSYADINPFVLAIARQAGYQVQYPTCNYLNADINTDGVVSYADINPFVALLAE